MASANWADEGGNPEARHDRNGSAGVLDFCCIPLVCMGDIPGSLQHDWRLPVRLDDGDVAGGNFGRICHSAICGYARFDK